MRFVADLADWDNSLMNITTGQSGQALSSHRTDQWQPHWIGESLRMQFDRVETGGTLYHLQYPASQTEATRLVPRIKRHIEIEQFLPEIKPGMAAAVEVGTARRAGFDPEEPIYGKTGTCTDRLTPTHLGWFGSYNEVAGRKLVVVVLLTGGAPTDRKRPLRNDAVGQIDPVTHLVGLFHEAE